MHFSTAIVLAGALAVASSAALEKRALTGQATFYGGNTQGGTCSFSTYTIPSGLSGTALSDSNWDTSANCGACISVTGPGGNSTTVMVVDKCPGCGVNHLDLFPQPFSALANPSKGVIPISWNYVPCGITSPLILHNKSGVSAYWFSVQVVNANKRVSKVEVSTNGGSTWQSTTRQDYNFFEASSGFKTTTADIRVTSIDGDIVIVKSFKVVSDASTTASSNFPGSPSKASADKVAEVAAQPAAVTSSANVAPAQGTPQPLPTHMAGAAFNEVSYSAAPMSEEQPSTTIRSTTTTTRTSTVSASTYTLTSSIPVPTPSPVLPSNSSSASLPGPPTSSTSSALAIVTTYPVALLSSSVSIAAAISSAPVISVSVASHTVVPVPSSSATAYSTGTIAYPQNTTTPGATSTPIVFTGAGSKTQLSLLGASFACLVAAFII